MTSITRSEFTRPAQLVALSILELNGLVLLQYNSVYGYAFEVLTQNGQQRISHGNDRKAVIKKAIEYLEARAVLDGKPMKALGGEYVAAAKQWFAEEVIRREQERMKALINVRNIS